MSLESDQKLTNFPLIGRQGGISDFVTIHGTGCYGLYAGSKLRLQTVRMILGASFDFAQSAPPTLDMREWLASLRLDDVLRCPFCE